ncbi:DUF3450 domain-containing protein [Alkalimarinus alittae]|uniref:DUF3450 domain-containing protein n=1 Tax=Alkalimarinus alittae TaxID=2961619 RepID=A0ABY6N2B8_9ALTE|nr:DUF3450 domain-containing protein [Alkalimarinus alittae]UZE96226.1 DUF3450 domain-containing protein [Alkalimarinus alittae]
MKKQLMMLWLLLVGWESASLSAATVDDSLKVVSKTNQSAIASQQRIDSMALQTQKMLEEYQNITLNTEYQNTYNYELKQLKEDQEAELESLQKQIDEINVTQLRIMPLMNSMADSLEKFVVLDLPFHQEQRVNGVIQLKQHLRNPSLSLPDKYRLLLEAYQIENDYGRSVETYRDSLDVEGESLSVEFLRIGRVALYYRTLDGATSAYWNMASREWEVLPAAFGRNISDAIRVAGNQVAPQLLQLPMVKPE